MLNEEDELIGVVISATSVTEEDEAADAAEAEGEDSAEVPLVDEKKEK